ncbi:MAG: quinone-dependent dihydroorotate dehydrogenase, partial [Pseudomonadota bacterium]
RYDPSDERLETEVAGLKFSNPLGLAAGFDKNAEAIGPLLALGFGAVEVGAVTPRPQPGSPKPRLFRLPAHRALINRLGFNNEGLDAAAARLAAWRTANGDAAAKGRISVNLGANKDSEDRVADYVRGLTQLAGLVDYATINVSSPNTPGLRDLQSADALAALLGQTLKARDETGRALPLFVKIAPDLTDEAKADVFSVALASGVDGVVVSNTTLARPDDLASGRGREAGGLSGKPLFRPSTELLREAYSVLRGRIALIGVGGVFSARDAYEKILSGADLLQLYTALIYEGPRLPSRILKDLPAYLAADGFGSVAEAVGAGAR